MKSDKNPGTSLPLKGTLAKLPRVSVSRKSANKSARNDNVVYGIRTAEDIAEAFGRREREIYEA